MNLKILLPSGVFATVADVTSIVAETREGAFGVLPHRLDCVAALTPGILSYVTETGTAYLAVDEGALSKQGADVMVSVRRCIRGATLRTLRAAVDHEFRQLQAQDLAIRRAVSTMEGGLLGRVAELHRER